MTLNKCFFVKIFTPMSNGDNLSYIAGVRILPEKRLPLKKMTTTMRTMRHRVTIGDKSSESSAGSHNALLCGHWTQSTCTVFFYEQTTMKTHPAPPLASFQLIMLCLLLAVIVPCSAEVSSTSSSSSSSTDANSNYYYTANDDATWAVRTSNLSNPVKQAEYDAFMAACRVEAGDAEKADRFCDKDEAYRLEMNMYQPQSVCGSCCIPTTVQ